MLNVALRILKLYPYCVVMVMRYKHSLLSNQQSKIQEFHHNNLGELGRNCMKPLKSLLQT